MASLESTSLPECIVNLIEAAFFGIFLVGVVAILETDHFHALLRPLPKPKFLLWLVEKCFYFIALSYLLRIFLLGKAAEIWGSLVKEARSFLQRFHERPPKPAPTKVECCKTLFADPLSLFCHAEIHLWENELDHRQYWARSFTSQATKSANHGTAVRYRELRRSEFRLLNVLSPRDKDDMLRFDLSYVTLDSPSCQYVALSYCWGKDSDTAHVQIGKTLVKVSQNMERALRKLVQSQYRTLWVDRLCIQQDNVQEKENELPKIGQIFRNAREVSVWLGDALHNSDKVMDLIVRAIPGTLNIYCGHPHWNSLFKDPPSTAEVDFFFAREYWTRSWIIQECTVARNLKIYCGEKRIEWEHLVRFFEDSSGQEQQRRSEFTANFLSPLRGPESDVAKRIANVEVVSRLIRSRNMRLDGKAMSLLQVLQYHRYSVAKKGHDKVFALLGLAYDGGQYVTSPQYLWSLRDLCLELTKSFILSLGDTVLDIIITAQRKPSPLRLPSWCPDYLHIRSFPFDESMLEYVANQDKRYRLGNRGTKWRTTSVPRITTDEPSSIEQISFYKDRLFVRSLFVGGITNVNLPSGLPGPSRIIAPDPLPGLDLPKPPSDAAILDALSRLFTIYLPEFQTRSEKPDAIKYLFFDLLSRAVTASADDQNDVGAWLRSTRDFEVFGRSIRDRVNLAFGDRLKNVLFGKTSDTDWASTLIALKELQRENLALMTTNMGGLGWVSGHVRVGDEIHLLAKCSLPVVLRREQQNLPPGSSEQAWINTVVGYAIVDGYMDGQAWRDATESSNVVYGLFNGRGDRESWLQVKRERSKKACIETIEIR